MHHMQQKMLLLSESTRTQKGEAPQHLLFSSNDPKRILCIGSERIYSAYAVLHDPVLKKKKRKSPFFGCFLLYSGIHHTLPGTQPNLLISQSSPLPELPCSLCSVIPCPREGVFMIKWLQIYSGWQWAEGWFLFHELIPQLLWNLRGSVGRR